MYMYTCVLREETNRYAARYYSTFNISGVAPSCFPSFVPFLLSPSFLLHPFFSFELILFGELIASHRFLRLLSSRENNRLE